MARRRYRDNKSEEKFKVMKLTGKYYKTIINKSKSLHRQKCIEDLKEKESNDPTSVINERLTVFIDSNQIMSEAQAGFRKGYSTTDQIFTLKCIVELCVCQGRRLFCTSVAYSKAFDSINRATLWK